MKGVRFTAAGGSILVNGLVLAGLLTLAGPQAVQDLIRPVQVALITAPPEPPRPQPVLPPPPKPEKAPAPPERTRREPPPARMAPAAPAPVVAARPVEENRPAAIAAEPAPPSAPVAPAVTAPPAPPAPPPAPVARAEPRRVGPQVNGDWQGNAPPPYPMLAKRLGDSGTVTIDVNVAADGRVTETKLRKSSGSQVLDNTALETVRNWRFRPATIDGQPVAAWYNGWTWTFKLDE